MISGTFVLTDTINKTFTDLFTQTTKGIDVAVLYASGFPASALTARSQLHIDGPLLNKPYRKEQLAEAVYRVLARRRGPIPSGGGTP